MQTSPVTIQNLLENRQRFCVPIYQRHYVWTREKQWEPFWNDVRSKAIERLAERDRRFSHFMGAVVLEARGGSSKRVTSYQVVDGQQRLTTFQLFLSAVRDYATQVEFKEIAERVEGFLFNDRPNSMENPDIEIFKIWPTKYDRELFQDILKLTRKELRRKYRQYFYAKRDKIYGYRTVPNLLGAYGFFYDCIKYAVESDDLDDDFAEVVDDTDGEELSPPLTDRAMMEIRLDAIWEALIEEFKVVEIILEEGDDAQVIFETLNERGEPLLAADLVRNNIFYRADSQGENAEKLFSKYWTLFEDPFWNQLEKQGRYRKPRIEFFIANFISGRIANEVTLSKLFSEYKAFLKFLRATLSGGYPSVEDEIKDLRKYGVIYRILLERSDENPLGRFARQLHSWDVTTVFPFVLRLWAHDDLENEEKEACLPILLSFIVRRAICGLTTKNYNKFFLSVVRHLDREGWSHDQLVKFLTIQSADTARFPTDTEFRRAWLSTPVYQTLGATRVRSILESLEKVKRKKYQETDQLGSSLSVEHILPTDWREHWPLSDGLVPTPSDMVQAFFASEDSDTVSGRIARRQRLKDTFGNLTILTLPLNSSVSNKDFITKRDAIAKHSLLVLNREISREKEWGEEQIEKRGEVLFSIAQHLWAYPDSIFDMGNAGQVVWNALQAE